MTQDRLLAGPHRATGAETLAAHLARSGPLPPRSVRRDAIPTLEASGLLGRGGAGFPVGRKWRAVAERSGGRAVVLANGAEGEPASAKDRTLMTMRPHLVLDGALLAADAVGADEIVLYIGGEHRDALAAMGRAVAERLAWAATLADEAVPPIRIIHAPPGYVSGEESAAVHFVNDRDARPTTTPPRPFERGVNGRPTLVQNVESLAHAALIARFGDAWYRSVGAGATPGTALVTLSGAVDQPGVREIALGTPLGELARRFGGSRAATGAILLGGYLGGWAGVDEAWDQPLDPTAMRVAGRSFGCGVVSLLPAGTCGVASTARILRYMAGQAARQCGPCEFGLAAIAGATDRLAAGAADDGDLERIGHWSTQLVGRGACRHPDGAVGLLHSALRVFADEFALHQGAHRCSAGSVPGAMDLRPRKVA